jgi:hypothetical protein
MGAHSPSIAPPASLDPAAGPVIPARISAGRARRLRYLHVLRPLAPFSFAFTCFHETGEIMSKNFFPPRPTHPVFLMAFGRLRRHASISSSNLRFLFSRRRSAASLAFLLFLRARSRSLRRSVMLPSIVDTSAEAPEASRACSSSLMAAIHSTFTKQ